MKQDADQIFKKFLNNECSEAEVRQLVKQLADTNADTVFNDLILAQLTQKVDADDISDELRVKLAARFRNIIEENADLQHTIPLAHERFPKRATLRRLKYAAVAALAICVLSAGLYVYQYNNHPQQQISKEKSFSDAAPGGNKAVLTLANGKQILLTDAGNGVLAKEAGMRITKTADGQLVYHIDSAGSSSANNELSYNTISTPRGGQYQVNLPDGSKVWLNAASSLKFHADFSKAEKRDVILTGEAYFEVAKDKHKPFTVSTGRQSLEVLGTHFNVSAYANDNSTKTTLIEGAVSITSSHDRVLLKPGQQAELIGSLKVSDVDAEESIAWKKGYFSFDDEELESIMKKISRWYDVDVAYKDAALKHELFAAYASRFSNVSLLLKRLNQVGKAHFELEGRIIQISWKR